MSEKLQFRISSALKDIIGKDLITDDFVAIFELVKNSFDAFAENVGLYFYLNRDEEKIFIVDDGKGMNKSDIINKWLFVAFSAKKEQTEDKERRIYSGYKGIGRFSCDRLGRYFTLYSKTEKDDYIHSINIEWDDFEKDSNKDFTSINANYSYIKNATFPKDIKLNKHGVVLEVSLLREPESWDRKKLIKLKRSLQKLIDPIGGDTRNITLNCDSQIDKDKKEKAIAEKKKNTTVLVNGLVENTIFSILEGKTTKLKAEITEDGKLVVELIDRGIFIYKTSEDIIDNFPELIDSNFHTEFSYLNRSSKYTFKQRMGVSVVEYGSLFLIRNGFRVFPVGEENNDYWGFDRRKQQGYARYLGSRDLIGFVKISGNEIKFKESTSRNEGLIQTKAAKELSECIKLCLVKFEAYVVDVTWKDKLDAENTEFDRMGLDNNRFRIIELIEKISNSKNIAVLDYNRDLISILNDKAKDFEPSIKKLKNIAEHLNDKNLIHQATLAEKILLKAKIAEQEALKLAEQERLARKKVEVQIRITTKDIEKVSQEKQKIESEYKEEVKRNIFLAGSTMRDKDLLEGFIHQIILYASQSKAKLQNILQIPKKLDQISVDELKDIFAILFEINEKIISTSRFATTANFRLESSMITEDLNGFIIEYIEKIAIAYNSRINIVTNIDSKKFELTFNPIEIGMVIENLISNAKKSRASNIVFSSLVKSNIIELCIEDNGRGIDNDIRDRSRIFEKGFTRTDGSGLGLYHSKNIIESLGGEISILEEQPSVGAKFIIKVAK